MREVARLERALLLDGLDAADGRVSLAASSNAISVGDDGSLPTSARSDATPRKFTSLPPLVVHCRCGDVCCTSNINTNLALALVDQAHMFAFIVSGTRACTHLYHDIDCARVQLY
jgi:hypothetical protein